MKLKLTIPLIVLLFTVSGCIQQIAISSLGGVMDNGFAVLNEEQDLIIAEASIASNLKLLESILRSDPNNTHYLLLASMGYSSYALGFVEDDSTERARVFYLRARDYGLRILNRNKDFAAALTKSPEELRVALNSFSKKDIPSIFWTAVSWGSAISINLTNPDALADLGKVETMMMYVAEIEPEYFYGGAHFFLGTLAGSRPAILGGNMAASRKHFEECLKINGGKFLMTYVYFARSYAVQTQNRELFDSCLTQVDTTSLDILPEARLSNAIAKKKAGLLRSRADEFF